jgi:hypothetical protein
MGPPPWLWMWAMTPLLPGNPSLEGVGQGFTVIEMALIIVAIGVQAWSPAARTPPPWPPPAGWACR